MRTWQVLGAFGLSSIYLCAAVIFSLWLSEQWQAIIWRAFIVSFAGALAAVVYVNWKHGRTREAKARGEAGMILPIRNYLETPLTLFIEPWCEQYEIPSGGEAHINIEDGRPYSLDVHPERWVSFWDESTKPPAMVEVFATRPSLEKGWGL